MNRDGGSGIEIRNLFDFAPSDTPGEIFETLLQSEYFRLIRIVSTGQATPAGAWLDQDDNEWVLVLTGSAVISFADDSNVKTLNPGDTLHIPAHLRHRVDRTDPEQPTVWLALHYR